MNLIICVAVGAVIGILLNYLADVLPDTNQFTRPLCKKCGHAYSFKNYLFSFKCPECGSTPGIRYWLTLFLGIVFTVLLAFFPLRHFTFWQSLPLVFFLSLVVIIDIEHRFVLLITDFVGLILGVVYGLNLHTPLQTILGGLAGAGIMLVFYYGGILFNKIAAKVRKQEVEEVALGLGDVIVCGYLGLITGIQHILGLLVLTIFFSGVFAIFYILVKWMTKKYNAFSAIPYVPFMVLALIVLFYLP